MTKECEGCGNDKEQDVSVESAALDVIDAVSEFTVAVSLIEEAIAGIDVHTADLKSGIDSQVASAKSDIDSQVATAKSDINLLAIRAKAGIEQHSSTVVMKAIQENIFSIANAIKEAMGRLGE